MPLDITYTWADGDEVTALKLNTNQADIENYINGLVAGTNSFTAINAGSGAFSGNVTASGNLTVSGDLSAGGFINADGWASTSETWTYASSTTFTISGDKTGKYSKGDKIKLTQTTVKYFYITSVSYSAPNTTITIYAGNDYTLANAAITSPYFSKISSPNGFPTYFNFTPTGVVGFSGSPTAQGYFFLNGCFLTIAYHFNGTSNSFDLTATVPFTVTTPLSVAITTPSGQGVDNGASISTAHAFLSGSTLTCYPSHGGSWTNSGGKQITGFVYGVL